MRTACWGTGPRRIGRRLLRSLGEAGRAARASPGHAMVHVMSTAAPLQHVEERRISLDEWASLPEDEPGELVDGLLVEEEVADWDHEDVVAWLMLLLGAW